MDEPFKSLDYVLGFEMLHMFMKIWRLRRNSVLFVTHDLDEALSVASRLIVLSGRPAKVCAEFELGAVENPRDVYAAGLMELKRKVIGLLKDAFKAFSEPM